MKILKQIIIINLLLFTLSACGTSQNIKKHESHTMYAGHTMSAGSAVKAEIINRILHVTGTNRDDHIEIQETNSRIIVHSLNKEVSSFPKNQISEVIVWGLGGNDTIKNMHNGIYNSITFTAHGGSGNNYIWGGSGKNTLDGGNGDNMIIGGTGTNVFHNTGHGSSAFFWRGNTDSWALGSRADYNDAQLVFYNKDRAGRTSGSVMNKTYSYVSWTDEDLSIIIDAITHIYKFTGSYRYAHNPRSGVLNGSNYFVLFDYPEYVFFARNSGSTSTIQLKRGTYTKSTIIHELGHNWQGTARGEYNKVPHYKSLRYLWQEFNNISWTAINEKRPDASSEDFANSYGMTNWGEDWCTTLETVFRLTEPSSNYGKSSKWNQKTDVVKRFMESLAEM